MANDKPFQVRETEGNLHSEHATSEQAVAAVVGANERASALGIATRYEAVEVEE